MKTTLVGIIATAIMAGSSAKAQEVGEVYVVGADWCGPCGPLKDKLDGEGLNFRYVDASHATNVAGFRKDIETVASSLPAAFIDTYPYGTVNSTDIYIAGDDGAYSLVKANDSRHSFITGTELTNIVEYGRNIWDNWEKVDTNSSVGSIEVPGLSGTYALDIYGNGGDGFSIVLTSEGSSVEDRLTHRIGFRFGEDKDHGIPHTQLFIDTTKGYITSGGESSEINSNAYGALFAVLQDYSSQLN